jgi:hypothetical protein
MTVTPFDQGDSIEVRWPAVTRDVLGHPETVILYRVFRYENAEHPDEGAIAVSGDLTARGKGQLMTFADEDPALRPEYGEKNFWYRVECEDEARNVSARSTAVAGHLRDITPPATPGGVAAAGFDDYIRITWNLNTEPDMDGYLIYRSFCEYGKWPCLVLRYDNEGQKSHSKQCDMPWVLLGYLPQVDALDLGGQRPFFDDREVPKASPLCYAYLVKAMDRAQNKSGRWPPDPTKEPQESYVCQRLRDNKAPDPVVITSLLARDRAIEIEWVGPPVQDIRAYYVHRSKSKTGSFPFIGGVTVPRPQEPARILSEPLEPVIGCERIALEALDSLSLGSFVDRDVDPKEVYWYKVVGVDHECNVTSLERAVAVSTFTFTTQGPEVPTLTSVTPEHEACGLLVKWSPAFDINQHSGFAVFRSTSAAGQYNQIGSMVIGASQYVDVKVERSIPYWYRVMRLDVDGGVSELSAPESGVFP